MDRSVRKKQIILWKKADVLVLGGIAACALLLFLFSGIRGRHLLQQPRLEISVADTRIGIYALDQDQEIAIDEHNRCEIRNGEVRMIRADCPDQICVHSAAIGKDGGSIVCLPQRIVLRIVHAEEAETGVDTVAE